MRVKTLPGCSRKIWKKKSRVREEGAAWKDGLKLVKEKKVGTKPKTIMTSFEQLLIEFGLSEPGHPPVLTYPTCEVHKNGTRRIATDAQVDRLFAMHGNKGILDLIESGQPLVLHE